MSKREERAEEIDLLTNGPMNCQKANVPVPRAGLLMPFSFRSGNSQWCSWLMLDSST